MTTLDPEGLEKAAEALHNEKYPAWLWGTNEELQQHYRGQVTAAVSAYLGHVRPEVTTVEELDALGFEAVVRDAYGDVLEKHHGTWFMTGYEQPWSSVSIDLPATVIHWGEQSEGRHPTPTYE